MARAMKASRLLPQPRPSLAYIFSPQSGITAPKIERKTVFAAIAEAACIVKASTRYVLMVIWKQSAKGLLGVSGQAMTYEDR